MNLQMFDILHNMVKLNKSKAKSTNKLSMQVFYKSLALLVQIKKTAKTQYITQNPIKPKTPPGWVF